MTRSSKTVLAAGLVVALATSPLAVAEAGSHHPTPPPTPANLEVPEGHHAFQMLHATGTQNYICLGTGLSWTFIGPQATLFDEDDDQKATHYLSPNPIENGLARATWQSKDSSAAWALAIASSTDPEYVAPGAIPWLLLQVVGTAMGPDGGTKLSRTTYIQRVNTAGGIAPAGTCPAAGARAFVPYETDYVFYKD